MKPTQPSWVRATAQAAERSASISLGLRSVSLLLTKCASIESSVAVEPTATGWIFPQHRCSLWIVSNSYFANRMPTIQEIVNSLRRRAPTFVRYGFVLQIMGRAHLRLTLKGERAQGIIVAYKQRMFTYSSHPSGTFIYFTGDMPIVDYRAEDGKRIRFEDWLEKRSNEMLNQSVPVLYDTTNPSLAMIDRLVWNWMP